MADNKEATVRTINLYREVMTGLISGHAGKVVDAKGDNVLAEFPSVVDAVRCAVEVQGELRERNSDLPEHRRMEFRIGINLGDVIDEKGTIYGDGVNVAARLEGLVEGGGICISGTAFDHLKNKLAAGYYYLVTAHWVVILRRPLDQKKFCALILISVLSRMQRHSHTRTKQTWTAKWLLCARRD